MDLRRGLLAFTGVAMAAALVFFLAWVPGSAGKAGILESFNPLAQAKQAGPRKPKLFRNLETVLSDTLNARRLDELVTGVRQVITLVDSLDFSQAPGRKILMVSKDAAYGFLLDNRTEQILDAFPLAIGALHNNVRNYLSSGSGLHTFFEFYEYSWTGGVYGSGMMKFYPCYYVTGSEDFIAVHGTNQEWCIYNSQQPSDRYLTHGCIRVLDHDLKQLAEEYRAGNLSTMILIPFAEPTNRVTQNAYTRARFQKWRNSCGAWQGPLMSDLIAALRKEWG